MDSRNVLLSAIFCASAGLVGCQTVQDDQMLLLSDTNQQINQVSWEKSGELFRFPNSNLKADEHRVVFFQDSHSERQSSNINIGIGLDNVFQTSLDNGHYSEKVLCDDAQIVNASVLKENGDIISYSKSFQLSPQKTTYLKVGLSAIGTPVVQQIPANKAWSSLSQANRQTHQISRMPSECSMTNKMLLIQPLPTQSLPKEPVLVAIKDT